MQKEYYVYVTELEKGSLRGKNARNVFAIDLSEKQWKMVREFILKLPDDTSHQEKDQK